jgi:acetyl-CoA carboxylase biotin carboxyl carrier protein
MINIDDIERIMQVVDKFDVSHFEFQQGESKVIIDKNITGEAVVNSTSEEVIRHKLQTAGDKVAEDTKESAEEKEYVKAAFAGTFYSVKEPGGPTFVKLNDKVESNTVVCLIEVMKLFNEVEAGINGIIVDILVNDGDFVEYGQPLFEIKK